MSINTIINYVPKDKDLNIVEIGTMYGASIKWCFEHFKISKYYAIDPFIQYDEYKIDGFNKILIKKGGDKLFKEVTNNFKKYKQVEFIRKFSNEAHQLIPNNSLDICFIDGNHEYQYVMDDIKNYLPKIKKGGIICGDDYFMRHYHNDFLNTKSGYPVKMVYEAVQDSFEKNQIIELGIHRGYPITWLVKL